MSRVKHGEFTKRDGLEVIELSGSLTVEDLPGFLVGEALDRALVVSREA
jgi:hypothetical protein